MRCMLPIIDWQSQSSESAGGRRDGKGREKGAGGGENGSKRPGKEEGEKDKELWTKERKGCEGKWKKGEKDWNGPGPDDLGTDRGRRKKERADRGRRGGG